MRVCPSILEFKPEDYLATIKKLSPYYRYFQIDFSDGIFVKSKTATIDDFIKIIKKQFNNLTIKQLTFDFHLMVKDYQTEIKKLEKLRNLIKIKNILIHYSAISNSRSLDSLRSLGMTAGGTIGLVLNPQDEVNDLATRYTLNVIPVIQIMSVVPGVQGNPFLPETLKKIEQLRLLGYRKKIFLDGAVNDKTMPIINSKKYRPDFVCPGSFLAKSPDKELENRVKFLISNQSRFNRD